MDAYELSKTHAPNRQNVTLVAKTKQELTEIIATNPNNPVAQDMQKGISPFWDEKIFYVMPVSLEAIRTNQNVAIRSRAEIVDGQEKVVQEHILVPLVTSQTQQEGVKNE